MQTNLRIKSISNEDGKSKVTDNITYVNPNLSDANAKLLAMKINALTQNTYDTTERIDTRDLNSDSKTDYNVIIQTWNMKQSDGTNYFGVVNSNDLQLNVSSFQSESGSGLPFRLGGLGEYNTPGVTITTSNNNFQVQHRSTSYGGPDHVQTGMRGLWDIALYVIGTVTAGDYFTVKINVLGDATHNSYERTLTFTFVEWTAGGE